MSVEKRIDNFAFQLAATNPVHKVVSRLKNSYTNSKAQIASTNNAGFSPALHRFLVITGWSQGNRRIFEAMPHVDPVDTIPSIRSVLYRLGFRTTVEPVTESNIRKEFLPCFLQTEKGNIYLLEAMANDGAVRCLRPRTKKQAIIKKSSFEGTLIFPEKIKKEESYALNKTKWSTKMINAFRPVIGKIFILSFVTNILALFVPVFVMTVYDKAIGAKSLDVLAGLFFGIFSLVVTDFLLRKIRGRLQAYLGARLDNHINETAFRHLLHLPLPFTQDAPLGSQLTRLKQMTSVRAAFTGVLASAVFDLPFIILFMIVIALIGNSLVFAPMALIVCYIAMAAWAAPTASKNIREAGDKRTQLTNLTVEAVSAQQVIFDLNAENNWISRFRRFSAQNAISNLNARQQNVIIQTISHSFLTIAGALTLAIGVKMVTEGSLTSGALIAVMALSWRVLNPIRNLLLSILTLGLTLDSITQIDRLLMLPLEREPSASPTISRRYKGDITFDKVSFRYATQKEPALRSVSFSAKPGQLICICGQSGSGKSTILRTLLGLYQQQAGSIFVDGLDLRQLDLGEWRQSIGVALEESHFFFGTVAQNMRLAHPAASNEEIENIANRFGLDHFYSGPLTEGVNTKISVDRIATWPDALRKRLSLCRAFIRQAPVYLLDNPADNLDQDGEKMLLSMIEERRASSTIIITTHRPSHMRLADFVMWLDQGTVKEFGAPKTIVPQLFTTQTRS